MVNPKYKALLRVAETGSFTQAANDLGYSQSGISGMISSLEKEMGVQLVVRDYGEAHLSAEGEDLLPWISNVCNGERQLASRIAELRRLERGAVRVAAPTSISTHWFPGMVKVFERKYPGVELHLMKRNLSAPYGTEMPIAGFWSHPQNERLKPSPCMTTRSWCCCRQTMRSHTPTTFLRERLPRSLSSNREADRCRKRKRCCATAG